MQHTIVVVNRSDPLSTAIGQDTLKPPKGPSNPGLSQLHDKGEGGVAIDKETISSHPLLKLVVDSGIQTAIEVLIRFIQNRHNHSLSLSDAGLAPNALFQIYLTVINETCTI